MVAPIKRRPRFAAPWHAGFLSMLPRIVTHARVVFRDRDPEARQDLVQEVVANAMAAYLRLFQLGKVALAYPSVLARYAIAQVRDGRKLGTSLNIKDVLSPYCQKRKNLTVERLDKFDREEGQWMEIVVEDRHAGPADIATIRLDFTDWLDTLGRRDRKVAEILATGETTTRVARRFRVTPGRVSQLRRELHDSWQAFQGEASGGTAVA